MKVIGIKKKCSQMRLSGVIIARNGYSEYGILTMAEIDELDRYRVAYTLVSKLRKAEERAVKEGWISADDVERNLGGI